MGLRGPEKSELLDQAIGHQIRRERHRQRLTLQVLADRAGVHINTVDKAEAGRGIGLLALCRVALALRVRLDVLVPVNETNVKRAKNNDSHIPKAVKVHFGSERLFDEPN